MWIILVLIAAFFNALWTAFSKNLLKGLSPFTFTLVFRALTALVLLPVFLYDRKLPSSPVFWLAVTGAAIMEIIGIYAQSAGVKKDFYSTYSLTNTSPFFTLFLAPLILPEKITFILFVGAALMVIGGIIFYRINPGISVYGIIRAVTVAISGILAKIALSYSSGLTYPFIVFIIAICLMSFICPFRKEPLKMARLKLTAKKLLPLAIISAMATLSYYLALQIAPVTRVNPLIRVNLLFGFLLSYFLLNEREYIKRKIFASTLIITAAVLISFS